MSMAELMFQDLAFEEKKGVVIVTFLENFCFEVDGKALGKASAHGNRITFPELSEKDAGNRFNAILDSGFANLKSKITGKRTVYVNKYFGLPLIGSGAFGIVDRNSSMLEIKPITGCNMNCIFCSVDEGLSSRKVAEIVIDKDYLVEEAAKIIEFKDCEVHIAINAHGEPTLYKPMPELIGDLSRIESVKSISLITNGTMLTENYIDRLAEAGLTRLNVSLNAVSEKAAKILEGSGRYDVAHVKKMCEYAAKKMEVVIAPVFVPGYNDAELGEIIEFAKKIKAKVGIQNWLFYRQGRNPKDAKQMPWENFYEMLKKLEAQHDFKLILDEKDFGIVKTKPLPKPFKKNDVVDAVIKCPGRYKGEAIAAAKDRNITIASFNNAIVDNKKVMVRIMNDKHNIFYGKVV